MSTTTTNYNLIKPELTDAADITATNENWDKIDLELKNRATAEHSHKADDLPVIPISKGGTGATTAEGAITKLGINATAEELSYMKGVTSDVQTQLNALSDDIKASSLQIASASSSDGVSYTATVESVTELYSGLAVLFVPNKTSASTTPTFNLNNLGAKNIRRKLSMGTATTSTGNTAAWFYVGRPSLFVYDGTQWIAEDYTKPCANDLYGSVPVANGGTGATTATDACENIGAIKKSGDTMTGALNISGASYPAMNFVDSDNGKTMASIVGNVNSGQLKFQNNATDTDYYTAYWLPKADTGLTGNSSYNILTSKDRVTVEQGGTGANNKKAARKNLGFEIQTGTLTVGTSGTKITFPDAFSGVPTVTANSSSQTSVRITDVTATGCTLTAGTSNSAVMWQAIYISN